MTDPREDPQLVEKKYAFCMKNCIEEKAEKFKCAICGKGFCGEEFVVKHINNKHPESIQEEVY